MLIGIGLIAGFVTAISPCVLPVLPILLAGGATGRKPLRIVAGLVASFVVFTLFAAWLLGKLGLPQDLLRNLAIALLFLVAATLLVPRLALALERPFARLTRHRAGGGGFLLGASLGLVFVPCAGPVLAAVTVVAANNEVGVPGARAHALLRRRRRRADAARRARRPRARRAAALRTPSSFASPRASRSGSSPSRSRSTQTRASRPRCPATRRRSRTGSSGARPPSASWRSCATRSRSSRRRRRRRRAGAAVRLDRRPARLRRRAGPAPGGDWFNTEPVTLKQLRGKVVLIDFWTYSCINCLRTLPHLEGLGRGVPRPRARDRRRAHARVRVRARLVQRPRRRQAARDRVPGRAGQRVRHLGRLLEPVLAGRVHDRPQRPRPACTTSARAATRRPKS